MAVCAVTAPPASAVIDDDPDGPSEGPCPLSAYNFSLEGNLTVAGIPFAGRPIQINAASAKLTGRKATATRICEEVLFAVSRFRWSVVSTPPGQRANVVADGDTLMPFVSLGGAGTYRIRLTACPSRCTVTRSGQSRTVGPFTREQTITAVSDYAPPPETAPLLPRPLPPDNQPVRRFSADERDRMCLGGGGVADPQWVTAGYVNGPQDYRLQEGEVKRSKVASQDNFLNHDSQDHIWEVEPDAPFAWLSHPIAGKDMEMEWETNHFPRQFRPTAGDRAATMGYWILDCGHGLRAEIHPPVGVAVQRQRAVEIPSTFRPTGFPNGFGTNVQVPGIVTDVYFNRTAGEITNNCSRTGLHQPAALNAPGLCIEEPHSLNRSFKFNIYLPRDPKDVAESLGLTPPPVPLFVGTRGLGVGGGGPTPAMVFRQRGGAAWLEVTIDLTGFTGPTWARRINAAWAYPNPDNWGARRWSVLLKSMKVFDDAEPFGDDGDWRMYFNTNNRDREWTQIISNDCEGCIDDDETHTFNLRTGTSQLGPNPVLFPGQRIFVHTTGFDEETWGDDIGTVFLREAQRAGDFTAYSHGGDGSYHLNVGIRQGPAVGRAFLTSEAAALLNAYTVRGPPQCRPTAEVAQSAGFRGPRDQLCAPAQADPGREGGWHPETAVLTSPFHRGNDFELYESEHEVNVLTGISAGRLRAVYRALTPQRRRELLAEIRAELAQVPPRLRRDYHDIVLTLERALPASAVARAVPPSVRLAALPFVRRRGG
ncbi:MAG TPA: hypothetical protein VNB64_06495 [Solirubrobacteraceae bacterium]|nr:hypothetical protein [Solirubrobacteraceae bacterium]